MEQVAARGQLRHGHAHLKGLKAQGAGAVVTAGAGGGLQWPWSARKGVDSGNCLCLRPRILLRHTGRHSTAGRDQLNAPKASNVMPSPQGPACMNALEHVDAIVTPPPSTDAPPASPVAAKRKPAL